ncbi:hypothetical protein GCM10009585_13690 [Brevibacterium paucivorans]|uniref:hypothetical protein n=1 Tax=Brevibacterium paucivorans TaxID=170994 RepID=UPI0031D91A73
MAEDHVGEFMEDELLSMECRVGAGVEHEVVGLGGQPERTEAVVGVEISQFNDPMPAVPLVLDRAEELVEGEGITELKARHGRRYGLFGIHGSPFSVGTSDRHRLRLARHPSALRR